MYAKNQMNLNNKILLAVLTVLAVLFFGQEVRADMDWAELEPDIASATDKQVLSLAASLDKLIKNKKYVRAVELAYGGTNLLPKKYRKKAVDNAIAEIQKLYDLGKRPEAAQQIMDFSIRFSQVKIFKKARNKMFAALVEDFKKEQTSGKQGIASDVARGGGSCVLARGLASWSRQNFKKHPQRGVCGFELANTYCPGGMDIAHNLGLAYYRTGNKQAAFTTWNKLAQTLTYDHVLFANLGWLSLEMGNIEQAGEFAKKTLAIDKSGINGLAISLEVLFAQGRYEDALSLAFANKEQVSPGYRKRAVAYAAAQCWDIFRSNKKKAAANTIKRLARRFPQAKKLATVQYAMTSVHGVKIPEPVPLPHNRQPNAPVFAPDHGRKHGVLAIKGNSSFRNPRINAYALVVGIKKYMHMIGPKYAEKDATQIKNLLTGYMGFVDDDRHITLLLNDEATSGSMHSGLRWLVQKAENHPDALILFYFSGNGSPVYAKDRRTVTNGLLLPHDGDPDHLHHGYPVSLKKLKDMFCGLTNKNILIIIDAGFYGIGKSIGLGRDVSPTPAFKLFDSNKILMTAADVRHEAVEYVFGEQGAFTYFFLDALMGRGDSNRDGWVDAAEAFGYAQRGLKEAGIVQNPQATRLAPVKLARVRPDA